MLIGGKPVACVGHRAECDGAVEDAIVTGSATVQIGGKPVARMGEITSHLGIIIEGEASFLVGGPSTSAVVDTAFGELTIVPDDFVGPLGRRQITRSEMLQLLAEGELPNKDWSAGDALERMAPSWLAGDPNKLRDYKDQWIRDHATAIRIAARTQGLPPDVLAAVAWIEAGGDPTIQDDFTHAIRSFDHLADPLLEPLTVTKKPEYTSFGDVQIQIRRAAEVLGMEPPLSSADRDKIISLLKNDQKNLSIVAQHLRQLADIDSKGLPLDDDRIKILGARYNRGSELPLSDILKNTSYGESMLRFRDRVRDLLDDPTASPGPLLPLMEILAAALPGDAMPVARGE